MTNFHESQYAHETILPKEEEAAVEGCFLHCSRSDEMEVFHQQNPTGVVVDSWHYYQWDCFWLQKVVDPVFQLCFDRNLVEHGLMISALVAAAAAAALVVVVVVVALVAAVAAADFDLK